MESNPLLETDDGAEAGALAESAGNADDRSDDGLSIVDSVDGQSESPLDVEAALEGNEPSLGDDDRPPIDTANSETWGAGGGDGEHPDFENLVADVPDLRSHLMQQLNMAFGDATRQIHRPLPDRSIGRERLLAHTAR